MNSSTKQLQLEPQVDAPDSGVSLLEYFQIIQRRRAIITQAFLIIAVAAIVITLLSRPVYQATARLLVEAPSTNLNSVDASNPISELLELTQPQSVDTQVEVLQSPSLIHAVSRETGVSDKNFKVDQVDDTNVIEATVEAGTPAQAANAANRLLSDYIDQDVNRSLTEITNAQSFVQQRSDATEKQLDASETALEAFKQKYRVADLETERTQQIQNVSSLQAAYETQEAQFDALNSQIQEDQGLLSAQSSTDIGDSQVTNPAIVDAKNRIADMRVQRQSLMGPGGYGPNAPAVKSIDAQITALQQHLAALPPLVATKTIATNPELDTLKDHLVDLKGQQAAAKAQLARTAQVLGQNRTTVGNYAAWEVTLDHLTRQHDLLADQYTMFQNRLADLALRAKAHHATATIIESAKAPELPVRPKRLMDIVLGCVLGLFVGLCLALLQEYLDDRINSVEDAERRFALPTLGQVPLAKTGGSILLSQISGFSPAAESYRILRTNINFSAIDAPLRTLVIASTGPGEGKSTTALNLAMAMAADGRKVMLVDTDLRRPTLHKLLELPGIPGLTDVLLGQAKLDDVIMEDDNIPNLSVISCGLTPPNPSELLGSRRFRNLVDEMLKLCDLIIFDTPPALIAADASVLASQADGTLLVVEAGGTKNAAAARTLQLLQRARANVLGICYNKIQPQRGRHQHYYYYYETEKLLDGAEALAGGQRRLGPLDERGSAMRDGGNDSE